MYYVYILRSKTDRKFYTGFTKDLRNRINIHNSKLEKSTKPRTPFELIYYEAYKNEKDALKREKFFKTGWGRQYINKSLRNYLEFNKQFKNLGGPVV